MSNKTYGYIRVSSKDQNVERQLIAMNQYGIQPDNIYIDKASGKAFARENYQILISRVEQSDTIVVKSIDRFGRNYEEILQQWQYITKTVGANIVVLDMPLLNTHSEKDLTNTLISDIVLQLLSYVAQTEREFIHQRQSEGIAAAKARGVVFGRKPKTPPENYPQMKYMWQKGEISARDAAKQLGICHSTFLKWAKNCS